MQRVSLSVKGSQWICKLQEPTEQCGTSALKKAKLNFDDCNVREEPELLAGSPPSDDFSSLLNTCVESQEISATDQSWCTSLQVADGNAEAHCS